MDKLEIEQTFFNSIKRGTGEAYLIAKQHPSLDLSKYIIKAILRNYAYDGQSEDSRARYLHDLMLLSQQKGKIRTAALNGLAKERNDTWTLTQLFDFAKILAQEGDTAAKQGIYDRFFNHPITHSDWVGYSEILDLDGMAGLLFIAEKIGKAISADPDNWQDNSIIWHFQSKNPKIPVMQELRKVSLRNPFVKTYLQRVQRTEENYKKRKQKVINYGNLIEEIIQSKPYIRLRKRKLTKKEIVSIAKQLLIEKDSRKQEKLLYIFTRHKFPFDSEFILTLAKSKPTSKNRIAEFAVDALQFLKSESIRDFALEKIELGRRPELYTGILISNYKAGDHKLLAKLVNKSNNEHTIENLARSLIDIYRANKTRKCKEPLESLYKKMNCGIHRNSIIEVLLENKVLSRTIRREIKHDSNLETRKLFERV